MSVQKNFGQYTIVRASALAQSEVLSLLSATIAERWASMPSTSREKVANDVLLPMMFSMPIHIKVKLHNLLIPQASKGGTPINLDIEYFQGKMVEYHRLLADLVFWNLDDFFTYIANVLNEDQTTATTKEEAQ